MRKVFRIRLTLERDQRRAWDLLEEQAAAVDLVVREAVGRGRKSGIELHRDFFVDSVMAECRRAAPDLERDAVEALIDQYREASVGRRSARRNRRIVPEVVVPWDGIVFSVTEDAVRIPYLGLVRYRPNQFITVRPHAGDVPTAEKVRLRQSVRRSYLLRRGSDFLLVIDCSHPDGRRRGRGRRKKGLPSKWLEG